MTRKRRRILYTTLPAVAFVLLVLFVRLVDPFGERAAVYAPDEPNPDITRALDIDSSAAPPAVTFVDCASAAGIDFVHFRGLTRTSRLPEDMGSGLAWGDFDNDGDDDLYVVDCAFNVGDVGTSTSEAATSRGNRLYENRGDGTFLDVTEASGTGLRAIGMGAAWGDIDNDGFLDLLTTAYRDIRLYLNEADGTFRDVTNTAGLDRGGFWSGAAFGDYDRDGDLDLFVCGYVDYDDADADRVHDLTLQYKTAVPFALNPSSFDDAANRLYRNEGDHRFIEISAAAGVDGHFGDRMIGKSLGAVWLDVNEDGWSDLYVANDVSNNHLYLNQTNGTFREGAALAWLADMRGAMGMAIGDFDNDRDPDLFISHWIAQENALYVNLARDTHAEPGEQPTFTDRADIIGLGQTALDYVGWGSDFLDFDGDGYLDLFVANGSTFELPADRHQLTPQHSKLYRNLGMRHITHDGRLTRTEKGFVDCGSFAGTFFRDAHVARGSACADYDLDGDVDLAVLLHGESLVLLRNDNDTGNDWVKLRLRGTRSNRFALGAVVHVRATNVDRVCHTGTSPSYLSGSVTDLHIGLGPQAEHLDVDVTWPAGGTDSFVIDQPNATYLLTEGSDQAIAVGAGPPGNPESPPSSGPLGARGGGLRGDAYRRFRDAFQAATRLRVQGRHTEAEARYREALDIDPDHADARFYLGSVLFETGRYDAAIDAWSKLLSDAAVSSKANFMIGVTFACPLDGAPTNFARAREHFARVFDGNREESGALLRLGELAIVAGNVDEAREVLQSAVDSYYSAADGRFLLSYVLWNAGDHARAVAEMARAVDYARKEGVPDRAPSGALTEGDVSDPSLLRLANQYRVRPLADRCIGLPERAAGPVDSNFCAREFAVLEDRLTALRSR